jgi:hypothetical protein
MASDIFRCLGKTKRSRRCKHTAVLAVKSKGYWCPKHMGQPYSQETAMLMEAESLERRVTALTLTADQLVVQLRNGERDE